jgi:transposase
VGIFSRARVLHEAMTQGEIVDVIEAAGKPGHRYFAGDSCVVDHGDRCDVLVGGTLVGSYEDGDKARRDVLLVMAGREPRVHLGKLAAAFGLSEETSRRIRRRYESGGLEALVNRRPGGKEPLVVGKLEARLYALFDKGVSSRKAQKLIKGQVSEATVARAHTRWNRERAARTAAEGGGSEAGPVQQELDEGTDGEGDEPGGDEPASGAAEEASHEEEQVEDETGSEPARTEASIEAVVGTGEYVQHVGAWIVLGMLEAMGVYGWLGRLRADAAMRSRRRFVGAVALRVAIDAAVIAFTLGQRCVEGVRRIATPTSRALLRSQKGGTSPEWVRATLGRMAQERGELFHLTTAFALVRRATSERDERAVYYVDGHMRPYTGRTQKLRRGWRMQDRGVRAGSTDYWVHDEDGRPLFRLSSPRHGSLLEHLRPVGSLLREALDMAGAPKTKVMLIFDRAGAFATEMSALRDAGFEFATYERAPYAKLLPSAFDQEVTIGTEVVRYTESRRKNLGKGRGRVRRIALLMEDGEQVNVLAISAAPAQDVIEAMLSRWSRQENQFKHAVERWGANQLDGRQVEEYAPDEMIPNPARRRLEHALTIVRRVEGDALRRLSHMEADDPRRARLEQDVARSRAQAETLLSQRATVPKRVTVLEAGLAGKLVRHRDRYKLLLDTLRTLLANVESELATMLGPHLARPKEAKKTLANLFAAPGVVRVSSRHVTVLLAPAGTRTERRAFEQLYAALNAATLKLPGDHSGRSLRFGPLEQ